jgi:RNA polymerase sigma-70 factor (ECF subfamily)
VDVDHRTAEDFERLVLPHLDAAYNLARWLVGGEHDAQDLAQEACLKAFKAFDQFRGAGDDARCWLLAIVRNACLTWLRRHRAAPALGVDDEIADVGAEDLDPHVLLQRCDDREAVRRAIEELPVEFREVLILREFEDLPYQKIAAVAGVPVGTVMSRLARARQRLQRALAPRRTLEEA